MPLPVSWAALVLLMHATFLVAMTKFLPKATCKGFRDWQDGSADGTHIKVGGESQCHRGVLWCHMSQRLHKEGGLFCLMVLGLTVHHSREGMPVGVWGWGGLSQCTHSQREMRTGTQLVASLSLFSHSCLPAYRMGHPHSRCVFLLN